MSYKQLHEHCISLHHISVSKGFVLFKRYACYIFYKMKNIDNTALHLVMTSGEGRYKKRNLMELV